MAKMKTANRFRALLVAVAITVGINYAISYVANASPHYNSSELSADRSGVGTVPTPPRPSLTRSGVGTVPTPPRP